MRQWFGHDPARWEEFRLRYKNELEAAGKRGALEALARRAKTYTITLVYAAHDEAHNNAAFLKELIERQSRQKEAA